MASTRGMQRPHETVLVAIVSCLSVSSYASDNRSDTIHNSHTNVLMLRYNRKLWI